VTGENPYFHRGPIKETRYFYGRARETALALQMVRNGQSVSVIGPRRVGKTSLLLHLADTAVQAEHGFAPRQSLFVYIDGQALGGSSESDTLRITFQEVAIQTDQEAVGIHQVVDCRSFEQAVRELVEPGQQLVFLIDEFECLGENQSLGTHFFSFLRSLTLRYSIVTASQAPLLALIGKGQVGSHFFNVFEPIYLGLFSEDDAYCLIREPSQAAGVIFSEETEGFILDLAGLHPFFLQIACFHAFDLSQEDPSFGERARRRLEERVQTDLGCHFEYFVKRLSEEERRVLARLLDPGEDENSIAALEALERKCLVRRCDGSYAFASRAFAEFFGRKVGRAWAAGIAEGDRRMATVLFVDVVGFTPMTEQHLPEEVLAIIKPALQTFVDVIDRYGGKVANFGGDSVMAVFGVPTGRSDDAVRAVRAALEIQANMADYARQLRQSKGVDFSARVGLDTGVVVLGEIGGEQRAEYTALGDPVNLAQRLESKAQPGTVVISDHTYQQVRGHFRTEALGLKWFKGKSSPVKAYRVLGERINPR
jgi:class 3 adenylate cyclase